MRPAPRRHLSYASLVVLLAVDVLAVSAFLLNQLVIDNTPVNWLFAGLLTAAALPWLLRLADKVFAMARAARTVPLAGESFP